MAKSKYDYVKDWRKRNPGKRKEHDRKYALAHPEVGRRASLKYKTANIGRVRKEDAERQRNKRKNDPEGQRARVARFKARKEAERVEIAGRPRPSVCDICHGNYHLGIVFDHCHKSGKFRGWLCDRCNKTLGLVKDSPSLLRKLAKYLEAQDVEVNGKRTKHNTDEGFCWS